ncbi:MAG: nucleotidyltransferase domain-containing protein [Nanoarchaeota archaeon]
MNVEKDQRAEIRKMLDKIAKQSKPDQSCLKEIAHFVEKINTIIKKNNVKASCMTGGSVAKGTFLKGDFDVDLFVRFDYAQYKDEDLSKILGNVLKPLHPELLHGSRDYFQIKNNLVYEVIPVLKIDDWRMAKNVTDMSPLHVDYVRKHLKKNPKLADEIRLAKLFCKSAGVYGAESYIQGFSGHVLDLLIIQYGSFLKLLDAVSQEWGKKVVIDIENHLKDPQKELNRAKTQSPIILVDPLQPERNAAAALSKEKYELFKRKAWEFLAQPSLMFFVKEELTRESILRQFRELQKTKDICLALISLIPLDKKPDVAGAKLMKAAEYVKKNILAHEFMIVQEGWSYRENTSLIYIVTEHVQLSPFVLRNGPPLRKKGNVVAFRKKHHSQELLESHGRICALEKRKYLDVKTLVLALIKDSYFKEKVKSVAATEFL